MSPRRLLLCLLLLCAPLLLVGPVGRFLVVLPLLLLAPGYLIERALPFPTPVPWLVRPALWLAGSLSIVPIVYAWVWFVGLWVHPTALALALLGCGAALCWLLLRPGVPSRRDGVPPLWAGLAAAALFLLTLARRFYEIRNDALPLWVDSVHHAVLVRVVAERGLPPIDLRPYLPVSELPYHWGFHAVVGSIVALTGLDLPHALLWSGQVLNALQVLSVAALAAFFWRSPIAGLVAALVVGLVSLMPAYLVTWGRYTLLDGLLILPPLIIAALAGLRGGGWRPYALVALFTGGLLLTHYIASVFALALLALLFLWHLAMEDSTGVHHKDTKTKRIKKTSVSLRLCGESSLALLGGALLALPWLTVLARRVFVRYAQEPNALRGGGSYNAFSEGLLWAGSNRLLFALAALALLLALWRRRAAGIYLFCWPLLLLFLANPNIVGLPVLWLVTNTEVLVSLYIPVAALIGGGVAVLWGHRRWTMDDGRWTMDRGPWTVDDGPWTMDRGPRTEDRGPGTYSLLPRLTANQWFLVAGLLLGAYTGERGLGEVINPTTRIAGAADVAAISWAAANTPADARFLTAATPWLPDAERGADGGWWLVPLAGRWSSTPPVLFTYAPPDEVAAIQRRTRALAALPAGGEAAALRRIIEDDGIDYIYVGSSERSFKAAWFSNDPRYERVYAHDGVAIFAVRR